MAAKILLIDDSETILRIVKSYLTKTGYEVVTASDAVSALSALGEIDPDVLITDIVMPDMDGYTLLGHIRKKKSSESLPVIVMSSKPKESIEDLFAFQDISGFLQKPFEKEEVTQLIEKALHEKVM